MIIKKIIQIGNPTLRQKSKTVKVLNSKKTQKAIKNLKDSIRFHKLVGLAGPQIGYKEKIFITEITKTPTRNIKEVDKLRVYINSKIIWKSKKEVIIYEGCGSVSHAQFFAPVKRPEKIIIEAVDENNKKFKLKTNGLLARVIQHEHDHLDGIEFIDKIFDIKKAMSREEYIKQKLN